MDPNAAPFIGQVAQWGAVGVLVAVLATIAWVLWGALKDAQTRYDALLALLLKHMPDSIKADVENVAALKGVDAGLGGIKNMLDLLLRKGGA